MLSLWFVFTWGERLMLVLASLVKTRLYGGNLINGETRLICQFSFFSLPHQRSTTVSVGTEPFIRFRCGLVVWPFDLRCLICASDLTLGGPLPVAFPCYVISGKDLFTVNHRITKLYLSIFVEKP